MCVNETAFTTIAQDDDQREKINVGFLKQNHLIASSLTLLRSCAFLI
jgi:hypothetical protein